MERLQRERAQPGRGDEIPRMNPLQNRCDGRSLGIEINEPRPRAHAAMGKSQTLRTIAELASIPEADLSSCLAALHRGIVEARRQHAVALREGLIASDSHFEFPTFIWRPTGKREAFSALAAKLGPETPIGELPLRQRVRFVLHQKNVFCLEDLSAISENELLRGDGLGVKTVGRLRELLQSIGLDLLPNPDQRGRELDESRALRSLPDESRVASLKGLSDSAPLSHLGLRGGTLRRAERTGFKLVGELRASSPRILAIRFGSSERREIYARLLETGTAFSETPSPTELWKQGLIDRDDMQFPREPETPLADLQPWLGAAFKPLKRKGMRDLGSLRAAADQKELASISGIGSSTADKLVQLLTVR